MRPETALIDLLQTTNDAEGTDIHFGTFTGLHVRAHGALFEYDAGDAQETIESFYEYHLGAKRLLECFVNIMEPGEGQPLSMLNGRVLEQMRAAIAQIEANGSLDHDIEAVLRLNEMGSWRLTFYRSDLEGYGMSLRALPAQIPHIEELLPQPLLPLVQRIQEVVDRGRGIILVTGTTGSGKSSTLAALIDHINRNEAKKIITLEDPVEYWHTSIKSVIHHRQIERDTESFASGLKGALRQDPDVILIGELRDLETISLAMTAAETGHLVLATLHSRNVESTITRIVDVFPPEQQPMIRALLASSLQAIISQALVPSKVEGMKGGRVLHPEIAILPPGKGGVRSTIHDGRYNQVIQGLETMADQAGGGVYYSYERTAELLRREGLM
jgi:twitching motility protein PilT